MPGIRNLVKKDIIRGFMNKVVGGDASDGPLDAGLFQKYTEDLLQNNPYKPPTEGCPINDLPNELLAYIFQLGVMNEEAEEEEEEDEDDGVEYVGEEKGTGSDDEDRSVHSDDGNDSWESDSDSGMDEDGDSEGGSSVDDDDEPIFQVLVSHVCHHWREVALSTPGLWTKINFAEGPPFEQSIQWIERSKTQPLSVQLDFTPTGPHTHDEDDEGDDDDSDHHAGCPPFFSLEDVSSIMDILSPHLARIRILEVMVNLYNQMHIVVSKLSQCPSAPLLETLQLYHYEDCDEYETFTPVEYTKSFVLFNNNTPSLKTVALWGVHIDWDNSHFLTGIRDLELAYHAKNVRPPWSSFVSILESSPNLETLALCLSGPADPPSSWPTDNVIQVPSVKNLVLTFHEPEYIETLLKILAFTFVTSLTLDYDEGDYSNLARILAGPIPGTSKQEKKSLLSQLEHLKLSGLQTDNKAVDVICAELQNLKTLNISVRGLNEEWMDRLQRPIPAAASTGEDDPMGQQHYYLPKLYMLTTQGVSGSRMKEFVEAREKAGLRLKKVFMADEDDVSEEEEEWLKGHLDTLEFFEPSDEEDMDDDDDDGGFDINIVAVPFPPVPFSAVGINLPGF